VTAIVQRWRREPGVTWTCYDDSDEWVVHHPVSAAIHLVNTSARQLWLLVSESEPLSADELTTALAVQLESGSSAELHSVVCETLAFMDAAGLVRPA
jgi:PqqD family protein of HPr-rel-A system